MSSKNCLLVMQTVLYSLSVTTFIACLFDFKMPQMLLNRKEIPISIIGMVVGGGFAGINKNEISFRSLENFL